MWPEYLSQTHSIIKSESGILQKRTTFLNDAYHIRSLLVQKTAEPKAAKISGNIFVIFSVYAVGIMISSLTMLGAIFCMYMHEFRSVGFKFVQMFKFVYEMIVSALIRSIILGLKIF